jgi:ankyrin repeat protein
MAEPFSLALGVLAVVQTAAATAEKLYEFGKTVQGAKDEIRSLNKKANSLHIVLQFIDDAFQDPKFQTYLAEHPAAEKRFANLRQPLSDCMESMEKLLDVLKKNTTEEGGSGARRIANSVKWYYVKDDVIAIRDELSDTRDTCTFAFTGMNMLISIEARIEQAEREAMPIGPGRPSPSPSRSKISEYQQQCSDLRRAARDGDNRLVQPLLDEGVPVDCLSSEGRTALSMASERGYLETAQLLIQHKANVNLQSDQIEGGYHKSEQGKRSPLHWAAVGGHTEIANLLLNNGADIEARTVNGRTPALEATLHYQFETTKLLIDRGANVNAGTHFGWTMLHHACTNGQVELVELLLAYGADVEAVYDGHRGGKAEGSTNQRPLHYVVKATKFSETKKLRIVELLLNEGKAKVGARDSGGVTSIHAAVIRHWKAGLELLLQHATRLDVDIMDKSGWTALEYAVDQGDSDLAKMLRSANETKPTPTQPLQSKIQDLSLNSG